MTTSRRRFLGTAAVVPAALAATPAFTESIPSVSAAIAHLRDVQARMGVGPDDETPEEECARNEVEAAEEDDAYEAIGRAPCRSAADLLSKFTILLEGMSERAMPNGKIGTAGTDALNVLIDGMEADMRRLLGATS